MIGVVCVHGVCPTADPGVQYDTPEGPDATWVLPTTVCVYIVGACSEKTSREASKAELLEDGGAGRLVVPGDGRPVACSVRLSRQTLLVP